MACRIRMGKEDNMTLIKKTVHRISLIIRQLRRDLFHQNICRCCGCKLNTKQKWAFFGVDYFTDTVSIADPNIIHSEYYSWQRVHLDCFEKNYGPVPFDISNPPYADNGWTKGF